MLAATKIRAGMVIMYENEPFRVLSVLHITPGNWRGMVQVKMRNLKSGTQKEHRFRSEDLVERPFMEKKQMEYLYTDGEHFHFMDVTTFEQISLDKETLGDSVFYILPGIKIDVDFYEGQPIGLELPQTVDLKVVEAEPAVKRQTASSSYKPAKVETGLSVQVPPFINSGDVIRINTESGEYEERVSK